MFQKRYFFVFDSCSILIQGMLMVGGYTSEDQKVKSAELYVPSSKSLCHLPPLFPFREAHTVSGLTVCGGTSSRPLSLTHVSTTCSTFNSTTGQWEASHSFNSRHNGHVAWKTNRVKHISLIILGIF